MKRRASRMIRAMESFAYVRMCISDWCVHTNKTKAKKAI